MPGLHPAPGVQWVLQREANYCKIGAFSPLVNSPRDWKTQIARQLMNNKFVDDWEQEHYNDFDLYSSSISKWVSNVNVTFPVKCFAKEIHIYHHSTLYILLLQL